MIENKINGKTYIGQHSESIRPDKNKKPDNYMGSGKLLKEAYKEYGIENFEKTILDIGEYTKEEINELETKYIKEFKSQGKAEYNSSISSIGGDTSKYIDYEKVSKAIKEEYTTNPERRNQLKNWCIEHPDIIEKTRTTKGMLGKKHSKETRNLLSKLKIGSLNNQYGKRWYTNGEQNVCVFENEIPEGFWLGRTVNYKVDNPTKGTHWYTNGEQNIMTKECPEGFKPGITAGKPSKLVKL